MIKRKSTYSLILKVRFECSFLSNDLERGVRDTSCRRIVKTDKLTKKWYFFLIRKCIHLRVADALFSSWEFYSPDISTSIRVLISGTLEDDQNSRKSKTAAEVNEILCIRSSLPRRYPIHLLLRIREPVGYASD